MNEARAAAHAEIDARVAPQHRELVKGVHDRLFPAGEGRSFAAYLTAGERDQLDARAATAERQRDDLHRELTQTRDALSRAGIQSPTASTPELVDQLAAAGPDLACRERNEWEQAAARLAEQVTDLTRDRDFLRTALRQRLTQLNVAENEHRSQTRAVRELQAERDQARANGHRHFKAMQAAREQHNAEWAHLRHFLSQYGDDARIPAAALRQAISDGPGLVDIDDMAAPPSLGSPADRAQDERPGCPACSGPVRETVGMVCRTCGTDYAPAGRAQDGRTGPGEGERTQEAADAHLGEPAGYEIIATRLYRDRRGQLVSGNVVVASAASTRPTLAEAVDELRSILGPAERAEG